ncbi:MAG TPA: hypothetical protein VD973_19710 [Symbiobacteriaceae bacterium]|jgi:hypothetical protein|nr:hypothetical protein [Symbiobacteriaceae bacterium]
MPNTGRVPIRVHRAELVGPHAGEFRVVAEDFSGVDIYPGRACNIGLRFVPKEGGVRRAQLVLHTDTYDSPWRVTVTGYAPSGNRERTKCPPITVERRVRVCPPVEIKAEAIPGAAAIFCGKRRLRGGGCEPTVVQELDILVPLDVEIRGACCGEDQPEKVRCTAVGRVSVELPLRIGATAKVKGCKAAKERP